MDFADLDTRAPSNEGAAMHVHGPDGKPAYEKGEDGKPDETRPVTLQMLGDDSDALTLFDRITTNEHLRGGKPITAELAEAKQINRLARACVGWSGVVVDGEAVKHSEEAAKALFKRFRWLRQQAAMFISDRANFLKASPQT